MALPPSSAPALDFESLLSRDYRPALVTRLIPREKYKPESDKKKRKHQQAAAAARQQSAADAATSQAERRRAQETSRLVMGLVAETPAFKRHPLPEGERFETVPANLIDRPPPKPASNFASDGGGGRLTDIPPQFHEVEMCDWESKINNLEALSAMLNINGTSSSGNGSSTAQQRTDPLELLNRRRNHHLDNLKFDNDTVAWDGDTSKLLARAMRAPLILELGVAGQSVANKVYQNTVLQRPTPAAQSDAYRNRVERDWSKDVTSTADLSSSSRLHGNKDQKEAIIAERQRKRAQMEVDKSTRVAQAMGTVQNAFGGGRGRTVTSSLMGPGGTERTGRPTRALGSTGAHETEYIEQLDLISSHALVRNDLSKILLREYMRPKLPRSVVRPDLSWQFQIRYVPSGKKTDASGQSSSYQAIMMGTHAGAVSKERLRSEADLSPTEGKLILVEYSEERPPVQMTKGMCSKIINYYRGDKKYCPVSAGGGDRPARRKRGDATVPDGAGAATGKSNDRPPRLEGPNRKTSITDWIGKLPSKTQKDRSEKEVDVLPEGVTEILHPKVHGPFIGEVEEGMTLTGLVSNLFVAPMFRHEPESTDFLMILTPPSGAARPGQRDDAMGVILRDLPANIFTVGQTEPCTRVMAPGSQTEKAFLQPFVSYLIARALTRAQSREGHGLRLDEISVRVLPSYRLPQNSLRQRLKQVAVFEKTTSIWTSKPIGFDDYPGVEALGRMVAPEGVAAFESECAARRRLTDLGINKLVDRGKDIVLSVGVTMFYLSARLNALREISKKLKKLTELSKTSRAYKPLQQDLYAKASEELETQFKTLKQKHEVAQFIYEELQLAPWHTTGEFLDVHKKGDGTGMMKLTGLGDPSGLGEGFSFLREADSKPSKSVGQNGALNAEIKKITGTENDLRKLTMKQMAAMLRHYGMGQKEIDLLKRWDRVHVIRDLSTKAASDGLGGDLDRFARGEKLKLSEQKAMYAERIKVIWKRQIAALSAPGSSGAAGAEADETDANNGSDERQKKPTDTEKDDSGSDSEDYDDFEANLEDEMTDRNEANQIVADHAARGGGGTLSQIRAATQDQNLTKEAQELAALKKQREQEREVKIGFAKQPEEMGLSAFPRDRKIIRQRITKTHPDGRQTTTFKFILDPKEVGTIMARLQEDPKIDKSRDTPKYEYGADEKPLGHSMFADEDDFDFSSKGRTQGGRRSGAGARRRGVAGRGPRARNLQIGKLKTKTSTEERMKKRKKEEDELDVYKSSAKRKGTSNRRERGSIRDRRPHIIFGEKLEAIRTAVESRPSAGPFLKPVSRKLIPRYYETISHPIDLSTIREKNTKYEYRTADSFLRDFELMKSNASKFNGVNTPIALEAAAIYDFVKQQIEASRNELTPLEGAVEDVFSGQANKKQKKAKTKKTKGTLGGTANIDGIAVNIGDLSGITGMDGSDSDDSF